MKKIVLIIFTLVLSFAVSAQKERKFVREGNKLFAEGLKDTAKLDTITFGKAEIAYRRALQVKPQDFHWNFNLADAIYKQKNAEEAAVEFERLAEQTDNPMEKSAVLHNLGNSLLQQKKFDPSIDAYKKALRINPNDPETKYNLAYAMKMKKEDEKQKEKQKEQDKDKDKDKDKDEDKDQDKDQNKDNQNQDQKQQDQPKPQQGKISRENAEQMLKALENDEKQTQEKAKKAQAVQQRSNIDKNW